MESSKNMNINEIINHWFISDIVSHIERQNDRMVWEISLCGGDKYYLKRVKYGGADSLLWEKDLFINLKEAGFNANLPYIQPCKNGNWCYVESTDITYFMMHNVIGDQIESGKDIGIFLAEYHNCAKKVIMPKRTPEFSYSILRSALPIGWEWIDFIRAIQNLPYDCAVTAFKLIDICKELDEYKDNGYLLPVHGDWMACNLRRSPYGIIDFEMADWGDVRYDVAKMTDNAYSDSKGAYDLSFVHAMLDNYFTNTKLPMSVYKQLDIYLQRAILIGFVYQTSRILSSANDVKQAIHWIERIEKQYKAYENSLLDIIK